MDAAKVSVARGEPRGHVQAPNLRQSGDMALLRLRRGVLGFRRSDVIAELERMHGQLDAIARSLDETWREKEELRAELAATISRQEQDAERVRTHAKQIEAEARAEASRIVAAAEEQAARIRTDAGRRVADAAGRLEELLRVREQVVGELRGIVDAYGSLLDRIDSGKPADAGPGVPGVATPPEPVPARPERVSGPGDLFPRHVELEAGPFADFAELSAFERSLARLPKVEDVYVRRFGDDRAEIELTLAEERPLVHDLTEHLPYRIVVTNGGDRLRVDVEIEAAAGAAG